MPRPFGLKLTPVLKIGVAAGLAGVAAPAVCADPVNAVASVDFAPSGAVASSKLRGFRILRMPPSVSSGASAVATHPADAPDLQAQTPERYYDLSLAQTVEPGKLDTIKHNLRQRGTGMNDAYLHGDHGLRMSVGSSYHMQYRTAPDGPGAFGGTGTTMRRPAGAVNLRDGYEGYAPVAMVGYDAFVSDRMKIGVEGGMMIGRSTAMYADETVPGTGNDDRLARNPVADVVMTYAF